jgi:superoxide dismutase, Cu-Zn family
LPIGGHAQMVRRADGTTFVTIHVSGLEPGGRYASHVHKQRCENGNADGHFQQNGPGGGTTPPNEIWLGGGPFNANSGGNANENATADYTAHADAVSVVVHDLSLPSTANKVACANLD